MIAVALAHLGGLSLALTPPLSPYTVPASLVNVLSRTPELMLGAMTAVWGVSTLALARAIRLSTGGITFDTLAAAACVAAACVSFVSACSALYTGLVGAFLAALTATACIPTSGTPSFITRRLSVRLAFAVPVEAAFLLLLSPYGQLALLTTVVVGDDAEACPPLEALRRAWSLAATHRTLLYAFACVGTLPLCAAVAAFRLDHLLRLCTGPGTDPLAAGPDTGTDVGGLAASMAASSSSPASPSTIADDDGEEEDEEVASFRRALRVARLLPKTELHIHLDGSLLPDFICERATERDLPLPHEPHELRRFVDEMKQQRVANANGSTDARDITAVGVKKNWPLFDMMNTMLQTAEELTRATEALCVNLRTVHNVWYCELRFCAALHTLEGLSEDAAVRAVVRGMSLARDAVGIKGGVILCALRSYPPPHPMDTAKLARNWLGRGVVGFDVAGSETFALTLPPIREALEACASFGVPVTVHAGELPRGMLPNLRAALDSKVERIGHGMGMCYGDAVEQGEDASLLARCAESGTGVEVCLTSICTASRVPSYSVHPIRQMLDAGVRVSLSVDNLTLSGDPATAGKYPLHAGYSYAHPSGELAHLVADCGFSWVEARQVLLNGLRMAFSGGGVTDAFVDEFREAVDRVLSAEGLL
jgi:adenosine deaminase